MRFLQDTARVILALWLAIAPVYAGSMALLGAGGGSGAGPPPTLSFSSSNLASSGTVQSSTFTVAATTLNMLVVKYSGSTNLQPTSISAAPNVGTTVTCTAVNYVQTSSNVDAGIHYCLLLSDANTATSVTITITYPSNPFAARVISLWYLPRGSLSSTTPVDNKTNVTNSSGTSLSINLNTSAGSFYVVGGASNNISANSGSFSATETVTLRTSTAASGVTHTAGDAQNVAAQAPDAITQTFTQSSTMVLVGASWR